ncbi:transcriptional regulator [Amycolatopsis sp. WAC 04197]|uniref:IclR family transcriptional regulator n=1 Tax=Amycolatopsis sp. WAC 04197 TaxID=2203199 RepID=UPI000F7B0CB1|nr:IclR family transcriptional regulator [Amycolatopsis sp. WAC 04197]RSN40816.1 transcriptional regulator [Amycolatopsis sp. WAC 04197]
MRNPPASLLNSVDHALQVAILLQQEGPLRLVDIAHRISIAPSTAHRLLTSLVYREFATQGADRLYRPGPMLRPVEAPDPGAQRLWRVARPRMRRLMELVNETVTLLVPVGTDARFISTVECARTLRVADRTGFVMPLHDTAGGRAILAEKTAEELTDLYRDEDVDGRRLYRDLSRVRAKGFAINDQRTEKGLTALGVAVRSPQGPACGAMALAMPTTRFRADPVQEWVALLKAAAALVEEELATEA